MVGDLPATLTRLTPTEGWNAQFAALKARFPKVRDSVVLTIHALQSNPDIALDDLKAQANLHGIRVTVGIERRSSTY